MNADVLAHIDGLDQSKLSTLSDAELVALANEMLQAQAFDRQVNPIRYYKPVSPVATEIHQCMAKTIGIFGGNGSSKTDSALAELVIRATGQIPNSLRDIYPREKLRGPIACRVVVESLTTTLVPIILPKLNWQRWQGVDRPGGERGHYGWIPKHCLMKGDWKESWSERTRTLQVCYRNPDTEEIEGYSTIQFMSYDQDPSDFASGDFHFILHDEPPKYDIWRENRARVMRVDGTLVMAMTWPDDPTLPVDWIVDELWEKAQPGANQDPDVRCFNMFTTDNANLNQDAVAARAKQMSPTERATRIYGQPIRMSNRVHPLFTDADRWWCFHCNDLTIVNEEHHCGTCNGDSLCKFNHVQNVKADPSYPVLCLLDPHPRKPHYLLWIQIDPNDDWDIIHAEKITGTPEDVARRVQDIESDYGWGHIRRIMDPNMGRSPSDTSRESTWQDAFERAGLAFDLADDGEVGRSVINDYLKPDQATGRPRMRVDVRCQDVVYQFKRYLWDDHKQAFDKAQKQRAKPKNDDWPTLAKYAANSCPSFRGLRGAGAIFKRNVGSYL